MHVFKTYIQTLKYKYSETSVFGRKNSENLRKPGFVGILAHRNWERFLMEPKYDLRLVSVIKDTHSSSSKNMRAGS